MNTQSIQAAYYPHLGRVIIGEQSPDGETWVTITETFADSRDNAIEFISQCGYQVTGEHFDPLSVMIEHHLHSFHLKVTERPEPVQPMLPMGSRA